MNRLILTACLYAACIASAFADSPAPEVPLVFVNSYGSSVIFSMLPAQHDENFKLTREAFGIASRLDENGKFVELYRTSGWYSFRVFVSHDGKYLVRMGPWNVGRQPQEDHLAVAFYKNGSLLKSYSTASLVKDHQKVEASVSHYRWQASEGPSLDFDNTFTLHTIDGWTYKFNATTGEINATLKSKGF